MLFRVEYNNQLGDIKSTSRLVLRSLVDYANEETGECYPSIDTIMENTGLGERAFYRAIKELIEVGLLTKQKRKRKTNLYTVNLRKSNIGEGHGEEVQ